MTRFEKTSFEQLLDAMVQFSALLRALHEPTGAALIAALQASPCGEIDIEAGRERMPVRRVEL